MDSRQMVVDDRAVRSDPSSHVRVLLVDDAECFRVLAREVLEERGFVVVGEAQSIETARRAVKALAPDALLLDVNLPDGNGFDLAAELKQTQPGMAILLISAGPPPEHENAAHAFVDKCELAKVDLTSFLRIPEE